MTAQYGKVVSLQLERGGGFSRAAARAQNTSCGPIQILDPRGLVPT